MELGLTLIGYLVKYRNVRIVFSGLAGAQRAIVIGGSYYTVLCSFTAWQWLYNFYFTFYYLYFLFYASAGLKYSWQRLAFDSLLLEYTYTQLYSQRYSTAKWKIEIRKRQVQGEHQPTNLEPKLHFDFTGEPVNSFLFYSFSSSLYSDFLRVLIQLTRVSRSRI